jgi:hypothetical protein
MPFVRWIGEPDPAEVNLAAVQADIDAGKYTKEDVWTYNQHRQIVLEGVSIRFLGPSEGLSNTTSGVRTVAPTTCSSQTGTGNVSRHYRKPARLCWP